MDQNAKLLEECMKLSFGQMGLMMMVREVMNLGGNAVGWEAEQDSARRLLGREAEVKALIKEFPKFTCACSLGLAEAYRMCRNDAMAVDVLTAAMDFCASSPENRDEEILMCDLLVKCYEAIGQLKKALVVAEKSLAHHCERGRAGGDQSAATVLRLRVLTGHSAEEDSAFCWSPACHLPAEGKLLCCSRCQTARYCGRECQKSHWPEHREECKRLASVVISIKSQKSEAFTKKEEVRFLSSLSSKGTLPSMQELSGLQDNLAQKVSDCMQRHERGTLSGRNPQKSPDVSPFWL